MKNASFLKNIIKKRYIEIIAEDGSVLVDTIHLVHVLHIAADDGHGEGIDAVVEVIVDHVKQAIGLHVKHVNKKCSLEKVLKKTAIQNILEEKCSFFKNTFQKRYK
jgi:hypothetical protein